MAVTLKDVVSGAYLADGRIDFMLRADLGNGQVVDVPFTLDPKEKNPEVTGPLGPVILGIVKRKKLAITPYAPEAAGG